jgi:hypothetical protein
MYCMGRLYDGPYGWNDIWHCAPFVFPRRQCHWAKSNDIAGTESVTFIGPPRHIVRPDFMGLNSFHLLSRPAHSRIYWYQGANEVTLIVVAKDIKFKNRQFILVTDTEFFGPFNVLVERADGCLILAGMLVVAVIVVIVGAAFQDPRRPHIAQKP